MIPHQALLLGVIHTELFIIFSVVINYDKTFYLTKTLFRESTSCKLISTARGPVVDKAFN